MSTPLKNTHSLCGKCFALAVKENVCEKCGEHTKSTVGDTLPVGWVLNGKYIIGHTIGEPGGFGIAYLAWDRVLHRKVVIKELFPSGLVTRDEGGAGVRVLRSSLQSSYNQQRELFLDEARKLARLDNIDSVVHVTDFFAENDTAYFSMSLITGESVAYHVKKNGKIDAQRLLQWIWQLCSGLSAVHKAGVFHRDIKPENLLIDERGRPVLIDFGNAKAVDAQVDKTKGFFAVSPNFGAPEQYANDHSRMGPWTDIYALGAIMYYCLSGQRPTDAKERILGKELPPLRNFAPDVSPKLCNIINSCMALEENQRPASIEALQSNLAQFLPEGFQWTEALPNNAFGQRMHRIHEQVQAGNSLPKAFNLAAGAGQSFWFFAYRLPVPALFISLLSLAALSVLLMFGAAWYILRFAIFGVWSLLFLPCAYYADGFQYKRLSEIGTSLPSSTEQQREMLRSSLALEGSIHPLQMLFGLSVPVGAMLLGLVVSEYQASIRDQVSAAIWHEDLRQNYAKLLQDNGVPPTPEELNFVDEPNQETKRIELKAGAIEMLLAVSGAENRRIRWVFRDGVWKCHSIDLEQQFTPRMCAE